MHKTTFGQTKDGQEVYCYSFANQNGMKLTVSNLGAVVTNLWVPDEKGDLRDVVLGYDSVDRYENNTNTYFGAIVGRVCNRTRNARFDLLDKTYYLAKNEGENNLHSGPEGYQLRLWDVKNVDENKNEISFLLDSPDLDQGYPGDLKMQVTYQLTEDDQLILTYTGASNQTTLFNPTSHNYFNLNGHHAGDILRHRLQITASHYTPLADDSIPTGEIAGVDATPMDFRGEKEIGQEIKSDFAQLKRVAGYDHNFVLDKEAGKFEEAAILIGDESHIQMQLATDLPGLQVYTSNGIENEPGKDGSTYQQYAGVAMETQYFPNAVNTENFTTPLLEKDKSVTYRTRLSFSLAD